jgi:hypothetical protein
MSAILLTNPWAAQQPPPTQADGAQSGRASSESAGPDAVPPTRTSPDSQTSGNSTGYSGSGSGAGGEGARQPASAIRRSDATPRSVVTAQATANAAARTEQMARDGALALIDAKRQNAVSDGRPAVSEVINTSQEVREAANQMPDPLPTSPYLRRQ